MGSKPITQKAKCNYGSPEAPAKQTKPGVDLIGGAAKVYGSGGTRTINIPGTTTTSSRGKTWDDLRAEGWSEEKINEAKAWREKNPDASRDQITETTTSPDTTKEVKTPGWEGTLMEETKGTVMQPWEIRQQSRADKKIARDQFRANIKAGMSRKEAKASRNQFLQKQANARATQQQSSAESGQVAGGTFRTGQREMLQGQLSKDEQKAMMSAQNEADQARAANPYGFDGTQGESIGTAKREIATVADTGLAQSTPDAFRQMRGTNPLEEKQDGITASSMAQMKASPNKMWGAAKVAHGNKSMQSKRGYKMGGFGAKNK